MHTEAESNLRSLLRRVSVYSIDIRTLISKRQRGLLIMYAARCANPLGLRSCVYVNRTRMIPKRLCTGTMLHHCVSVDGGSKLTLCNALVLAVLLASAVLEDWTVLCVV